LRKSLNRDAVLERKLVALRDATAKTLLQPSPPERINDLAAALVAWMITEIGMGLTRSVGGLARV
jgi:hypothetical protein